MNRLAKKMSPLLREEFYIGKLTNGLTVCLHPRKDFHECFAMMTVQFGSVDTMVYSPLFSKKQSYPAGIAHFLEHKMFEGEDGVDAIQEFSALEASANAFTSLSQTSYFFSTIQQPRQALQLLLNFLSQPHITEESVQREKSIISQEILMYQDDPDSRLYSELLASLYPGTALANDIAGSLESIQTISVDLLKENFETFYHPSNRTLFITGNFEIEEVWEDLLSYQEVSQDLETRVFERLPLEWNPVLEKRNLILDVASPKLALGIRSNPSLRKNENLLAYKIYLQCLFAMLMGWTSKHYQHWYEKGQIDSSFSFQLEIQPDYHFFVLTTDTVEPIRLLSQIKKVIQQFETDSTFTEEHFELVKREAYGDYLNGLNSLETVALEFSAIASAEETFFDIPLILENMTMADVLEAGRTFLAESDMTDFIIFPK